MSTKYVTSRFYLLFFAWFLAIGSTFAQNCGQRTITAPDGTVSDGSGALNYANNLDCSWLIAPENGVSITANFTQLDLGQNDFVEIYDGTSSAAPLLGRFFTGQRPAGDFTSTRGTLFIRFVSDGSSVGQGWSLDYNTVVSPCSAPVNLVPNNLTTNSVTVSWDDVPGAIQYELEYRVVGEDWKTLPRTNRRFIDISDLNPGYDYQVWVRSVCENGQVSAWSQGMVFTTLGGGSASRCNLTVQLVVEDITPTSATATWDFDVVDENQSKNRTQAGIRYELRVRRSNRFNNFSQAGDWVEQVIIESNSYEITGLTPDTEYETMGRVICTEGDTSDWSAIKAFRTLPEGQNDTPADCIPPTGIQADTVEEDGFIFVELTLDDPTNTNTIQNGNIQAGRRYEVSIRRGIRLRNSDNDWESLITTSNKLILPQLTPNTEYDFRARSLCENGDTSTFSPIESIVTPPYLGPVSDKICLEASSYQLAPGSTVEVRILVSELNQSLTSVFPQIQFDTQYLDYQSASLGGFFPSANPINIQVDESAGQIFMNVSSNQPSFTNSGVVATLRFQVNPVPPQNTDIQLSFLNTRAITGGNSSVSLQSCPDLILTAQTNCQDAEITSNGNTEFCAGQNVLLRASGDATSLYQWIKDGQPLAGQTAPVLVATETGQYQVTVTTSGCAPSTSNTVAVTSNPAPRLSLSTTSPSNPNQDNGSITATASNGSSPYVFLLGPESISANSTAVFQNKIPGTYIVSVTDQNGCQATQSIELSGSVQCPTAEITPSGSVSICQGSNVLLQANSGTNYEYTWFNNNSAIPSADGPQYRATMAGTYFVEISAPGCSPARSSTVNVFVSQTLELSGTARDASNASLADGSITVTPIGGQPPYTFVLQNLNQTRSSFGSVEFRNLLPGNYTVGVSDANGCQGSQSFQVGVGSSAQPDECSTPTGIEVSVRNTNAATIRWQTNDNNRCYILSYGLISNNPDNWAQYTLPHPINTFRLSGLTPGNYGVRLRTNCDFCSIRSGTLTPWSNVTEFPVSFRQATDAQSAAGVEVYPNPSHGIFHVSFEALHTGTISMNLIDLTGRTVMSQSYEVEAGPQNLKLEAEAGVYILHLDINGQTLTQKVIVN